MIVNAKAYNDKSSMIYEDAERLRKTMSNWMTRFNPAYKDGNYTAVATPLPEGVSESSGRHSGVNGISTPTPAVKKEGGGSIRLKLTDKRKSSTPAPTVTVKEKEKEKEKDTEAAREGSKDFVGKTFQQAQDQIMSEMIKYKDPE